MALIKEDFEKETLEAWRIYTAALENSLEKLEQDINEASEMSDSCTGEWCAATKTGEDHNDRMITQSDKRLDQSPPAEGPPGPLLGSTSYLRFFR